MEVKEEKMKRISGEKASAQSKTDQEPITKKKKSVVREILEAVVIALILTAGIRIFIVDLFWIPSKSMEPTLIVDDRIVVTRFAYWFDEPKRGEVVIFKYPLDEKVPYVKRLIGEPGDEVAFKDNKLYINGVETPEPYLPAGVISRDFEPVVVPEDSYFMCGDNREHSSDSRVWGMVKKQLIIGKGQFIYWPFDRLGGL